jgi:hypothetical protein
LSDSFVYQLGEHDGSYILGNYDETVIAHIMKEAKCSRRQAEYALMIRHGDGFHAMGDVARYNTANR